MNAQLMRCLVAIVSGFSFNVYIVPHAVAVECASDIECVCSGEKIAEAEYFTDIRRDVIGIQKLLCVDDVPREDIYRAFYTFVLKYNRKWFERFGGFEGDTDPLQEVLLKIEKSANGVGFEIPTVSLIPGGTVSVENEFYTPAFPERCPKGECRGVLLEFEDLYGEAQKTLASAGAVEFALNVNRLGSQWDRYFERSRSQTPLELALNSKIYLNRQTSQFSEPPDWQWILLHPGLVIENVSGAFSGEQTEEALMIEMVGANRWRTSHWYQPTGLSVVAVYADRVDIDDVGYGIAAHFNSNYSIGYTDRDGEDGFFITIDLLKPLQDKNRMYGEYFK